MEPSAPDLPVYMTLGRKKTRKKWHIVCTWSTAEKGFHVTVLVLNQFYGRYLPWTFGTGFDTILQKITSKFLLKIISFVLSPLNRSMSDKSILSQLISSSTIRIVNKTRLRSIVNLLINLDLGRISYQIFHELRSCFYSMEYLWGKKSFDLGNWSLLITQTEVAVIATK